MAPPGRMTGCLRTINARLHKNAVTRPLAALPRLRNDIYVFVNIAKQVSSAFAVALQKIEYRGSRKGRGAVVLVKWR